MEEKTGKTTLHKSLMIITKGFSIATVSLMLLVAGIISLSLVNIPGRYHFLAVQSGSMEPAIKKGSIVIVKPSQDYIKGDVVTIVEPANRKVSLTHRIQEVKQKEDKVIYVTKGDANESADTEERPKENVLGKTVFSIPYLGHLVLLAKTQNGLIFMIIIPATILIYSEILAIKNELMRIYDSRKQKQSTISEAVTVIKSKKKTK